MRQEPVLILFPIPGGRRRRPGGGAVAHERGQAPGSPGTRKRGINRDTIDYDNSDGCGDDDHSLAFFCYTTRGIARPARGHHGLTERHAARCTAARHRPKRLQPTGPSANKPPLPGREEGNNRPPGDWPPGGAQGSQGLSHGVEQQADDFIRGDQLLFPAPPPGCAPWAATGSGAGAITSRPSSTGDPPLRHYRGLAGSTAHYYVAARGGGGADGASSASNLGRNGRSFSLLVPVERTRSKILWALCFPPSLSPPSCWPRPNPAALSQPLAQQPPLPQPLPPSPF